MAAKGEHEQLLVQIGLFFSVVLGALSCRAGYGNRPERELQRILRSFLVLLEPSQSCPRPCFISKRFEADMEVLGRPHPPEMMVHSTLRLQKIANTEYELSIHSN